MADTTTDERAALQDAIRRLRQPATVRERSANIAAAVGAGESAHFTIERGRLPEVARRVARLTRERYPGPAVPLHSRWRQLEAGGIDRKGHLDSRLAGMTRVEVARSQVDLAVVSTVLDADPGAEWRYVDAAGRRFVGSEGLAVATFRAFVDGRFSSDPRLPMRVDAAALERLDATAVATLFQVAVDNPLVGVQGRMQLLQRLGAALRRHPEAFGEIGRAGRLFDLLSFANVGAATVQRVPVTRVAATNVLRAILKAFAGIWPGGQLLQGKPIGDVWPHRHAGGTGLDAGRVPFHLMSQWLAYSLVEPFQWAGVEVDALDELTALPEYRHGGLLIDSGVIKPRDAGFGTRVYTPGDAWVVEWRALTVTLIDELARHVRAELRQPELPLAAVLEGGTRAAGREIAAERRPGGPPPVSVASNGTLF